MSQAVYDQFMKDIVAANKGFTEKRSSLKTLLEELRRQIKTNNIVPFASVDAAKAQCAKKNDSRLGKYQIALANLVKDWGRAPLPIPQDRVVSTPVFVPPVLVQPMLVPLKMSADPLSLINSKSDDLEQLAGFASMDATTFNGTSEAKAKEKSVLASEKRSAAYIAASQSAGGKKAYPQSTLKAVYDKTVEAQAAVCTTFGLATAYVLTAGKRQSGKVRIEIMGTARGRGTHMFVIAGRDESSTIDSPENWGPNAYVVDPWGTATYGNPLVMKVADVRKGNLNAMYFTQTKGFYDNMTPDPSAEDNAVRVDPVSVERTLQLRKAETARIQQQNTGPSELELAFAKKRAQNVVT